MESSVSPEPVKNEHTGASRARRRSTEADEDGSAHSGDEEVNAPAAKRVKLEGKGKGKARVQDDENEDGDNQDGQDEQEDEQDDIDLDAERQQLIRDTSGKDAGYVTGSIVRIKCHSFLTYDEVEFRPGPALNMIIGPNGTGKSTIACAIAIGLGFPAKVLGRSTKLTQYCKNDSNEETWIEIELKGKPGKKNLTVRRVLSRDSEKTKFLLNGNEANAKEVAENMEELQVQVGNLCTFLPQDRVASFAMMSPSELLRETQKAAGHPQLSAWHQILIAEYKELRDHQSTVERFSEQLKRKQTKQADTEKEVRAFEQREKVEQDLAVVDILYKFAKYLDVFQQHGEARQTKTRLQNEVKELEAKNKPFKDSKMLLKEIVLNCEKEQKVLEKKVQQAQKDAASKVSAIERSDEETNKVRSNLEDIKASEKNRREEIKKFQAEIAKYTAIVENEPPETDTRDIQRQIREKMHERNTIQAEIQEKADSRHNIEYQGGNLRRDIETAQKKLTDLQQVERQREYGMQKFDQDGWKAVQWIRANKHKLRGRVFEPARLLLNPKKVVNGKRIQLTDRMLDLIEGPVSMAAMSTFLFEFREDYDFVFGELVDKPGRNGGVPIRFNGSEVDANRTLADVQFPFTPEQLNQLGLDGYAIDFLDGPQAVLAWLCDVHNLNKMPLQVTPRALDVKRLEESRLVQRYYTPDGSTSIKYSQYGQRLAQIEQRQLEKAKILVSGVDHQQVEDCNKRIAEAQAAIEQLKARRDQLKAEEADLMAQVAQIDAEGRALNKEKDQMSKDRQTWLKAQSKLKMAKSSLDKAVNKPSPEQKRAALNARLRDLMDKRVRLAMEYKDFTDRAVDKQQESIKINLQALQADSDHRAMETMVREKDDELEGKKRELERASAEVKSLANEGKALLEVANEAQSEASDEVNQRVLARREESGDDISHEALDAEREELQSNLNCMQSVSPEVLKAYNTRKKEIEELENKVNGAQEQLDDSTALINETKNLWHPRLKKLVGEVSAKFTASFDTLGLLGEVRLAEEPDYEKWGIEIMVSFRDRKDDSADATMHVLSGQRQSGGERALTTVTYLLALASLARAPFALVDEINQGMDQRAERNMHKMLVETTCRDEVGQYFLLTPKLLPDLVYHPKMKVLVINVSPWMPENLKLADIIKRKRKAIGGAGGADGAGRSGARAVAVA
ncbi:hypothetical protein JCM10207_008167 [Rhodosporidiobolus poonsookiae]